jgi:hypothetical protein
MIRTEIPSHCPGVPAIVDGAEAVAHVETRLFARTEGRFAPHFGADGSRTTEIIATQADRPAAWRNIQELSGLEG